MYVYWCETSDHVFIVGLQLSFSVCLGLPWTVLGYPLPPYLKTSQPCLRNSHSPSPWEWSATPFWWGWGWAHNAEDDNYIDTCRTVRGSPGHTSVFYSHNYVCMCVVLDSIYISYWLSLFSISFRCLVESTCMLGECGYTRMQLYLSAG